MEVRTRVRELRGDHAWLASEESGRCGLCGGGRGCGLWRFAATRRGGLEVPRRAGCASLAPGQLVLVSVAEGAIIRAAAATLLLPLAGLLGAAALARWMGAGEALGFVAAVGGALGAVWYGRRTHAGRLRAVAAVPRVGPSDG
ncbi:MAG TPA: SoxR reducing system RseC family protein [Burkholderiales bacterium]|nr:SoxR reducing system RseC family protein [Burkholderiales bacterium]